MLGTAAAIGAVAGSSLLSGIMGSNSANKAADASRAGSEAEIKYLTESRDLARQDVEPYRQAGYAALDAALSMVGLPSLGSISDVYGNAPTTGAGARAVSTEARGGGYTPNWWQAGTPLQWQGAFRTSSYNQPQKRALGGPVMPGRALVGEAPPGTARPELLVTRRGEVVPVGMSGPEMLRVDEPGYVIPNPANVPRAAAAWMNASHPALMGNPGVVRAWMAHPGLQGRPGMTSAWMAYPELQGRPGLTRAIGQRRGITDPVVTPRATGGSVQPGTTYMVGDMKPPPQNQGGMPGQYNFKTDPGYKFRFNEGMRAVLANAAARGQASSGGTMRALLRYGQGFASNEFQNVYNRIASIAGLGQQAASASGSYAMTAGQGMGSAAADAGNARASGYLGAANAWGGALNQGMYGLGNIGGIWKPGTFGA